MNCSAKEALGAKLTAQFEQMMKELMKDAESEPRELAEIEKAVMGRLHSLGAEMVSGLCSLYVPRYPAGKQSCVCGGEANYEGLRVGQCKGLLGPVVMKRPYYLCKACGQGHFPTDAQLGFCAGGISSGLDEILALMGAEFPFEEAATVVAKLTLVDVSPNRCRKSTEALGQVIEEAEDAERHLAWESPQVHLPAVAANPPKTLYISVDGVTVHIRKEGWRELKVGAVYTTCTKPSRKEPNKVSLRTQESTFVADIIDVDGLAQLLYLEAHRRGLDQADQVVFIGDGAHWIWRLADEYFPDALQILDWYHVSAYIWKIAHDLYGPHNDLAKQWANKQLKRLAHSQTQHVLADIRALPPTCHPAQEALTYFSNHCQRMDYARYRSMGLQIGSGTIESACHHVISSRLKGAGMSWDLHPARHVAKVRARLRGRRWDETIALRPPPHRRRAA